MSDPVGQNRRIILYGNPMLHQKATAVEEITGHVRKLLADLEVTMAAQDGLGLAANQIGEPLTVLAINPRGADVDAQPYCIINPRIVAREGEVEREEGCLSIPGIYDVVSRPELVRVAGLNPDGKPVELEATGLLARVFTHETDHLNGVLFIDHLSKTRLQLLSTRLEEIKKQEKIEAESKSQGAERKMQNGQKAKRL